jgi:WD40 repeat protein
VSGGGDGQLQFRSFKPGEVPKVQAHTGAVFVAKYSPDGRLLVSAGGDKKVKIWSAHSLTELRVLEGHLRYVLAAAFSPDSKLLATGGGDKAILLWDTESGQLLRRFVGHKADVESLAISPDGKRLVSVSEDKALKLWDIDGGHEIATLIAFTDGEHVVYTPAGLYTGSGGVDQHLRYVEDGLENEVGPSYRRDHFRTGGISRLIAGPQTNR